MMRKDNWDSNHDEFERWIIFYGDFLKRILDAKKVIKTRFEKLELIEAFVLRVAVRWELLVEQDVIASLNHDSSKYSEELGLKLRKHLTHDECEAILIGHRYLDFKSVDDVKNFAKKYLVDKYNPFRLIQPEQCKDINHFFVIRNLLAHYSSSAWRSYRKMMTTQFGFKKVPEPCEFLIACDNKDNFRWSNYFITFLECSKKMRTVTR
jgi:hypothetical protein